MTGREHEQEPERVGRPAIDHGALGAVIFQHLLDGHSLPWRVEWDWTEEVRAADGHCIAKCPSREEAELIVILTESFARHFAEEVPGG